MIKKIVTILILVSLILTPLTYNLDITYANENTYNNKLDKVPMNKDRIVFEENLGQIDTNVKYFTRGVEYSVYLYKDKADFVSNNSKINPFTIKFPNSEESVKLIGVEELEAKTNYIKGNNPEEWYKDVPNYKKVMYENIYNNINLVFYEKNGDLKYDFIVKPGANPNDIKLSIEGTDKNYIDKDGNFIMKVGEEEFVSKKPYIYQNYDGIEKEIKGSYHLIDKNVIEFEISDYDMNLPLIIDPIIEYSTYWGGNGYDLIDDIAIDDEDNLYVAGRSSSMDFPTKNGYKNELKEDRYYEFFVSKFDSSGDLIYSTFIGQSWLDRKCSIAVDNEGHAYVGGSTSVNDFPTTEGSFDRTHNGNVDGIVFKLNPSGNSLVYSTYLGAGNQDEIHGIAVDTFGNAYVTGPTYELDVFPTTKNAYQKDKVYNSSHSFVTKISPDGSTLEYSTLVKGTYTYGVAVDSYNNAYITGRGLNDLPIVGSSFQTSHGGYRDGFVLKLNSTGSDVIYSTFLGGSKDDEAKDITVDNSGNACVTGYTKSSDFPVVDAYQDSLTDSTYGDAFITKLNSEGSEAIFSTYLGGSFGEVGRGITTDTTGNIYVTGNTSSTNFPSKAPINTNSGVGNDVFVSLFNGRGDLKFSTDFGGNALDYGESIALDSNNNIFIGGSTYSTNYIITEDAYKKNNTEYSEDGFITKILMPSTPYISVSPDSMDFGELEVGESNYVNITVRNEGKNDLTINDVLITGDGFSIVEDNVSGKILGFGESSKVQVKFTPNREGDFSGSLRITSNADNTSSITVSLTGKGYEIRPGKFRFENSSYTFNEDDGRVDIKVLREGGSYGNYTIKYRVLGDSSAVEDEDYSMDFGGRLNFSSGITERTINLDIIDDAIIEENETIHLELYREIAAYVVGDDIFTSPSDTVITIVDNDSDIQPLVLDTTPLANGIKNSLYNHEFNATGGTLPYTFSISDGSLPGGLSLSTNGKLSGTPTEDGTFTFTLEVSDGANVDSHEYTLTINQPDIENPPTADGGGPYEINEGEDLTLDGSSSGDIDEGDSIVKYEWDLDNDGVYDVIRETPSVVIVWTELNGYGLQIADKDTKTPTNTINLRVTDNTGKTGTDSTTLTILPVEAPNDEDNTPPSWPDGANLTVSKLGRNGLTLNWSKASDPDDVEFYRIFINGNILKTISSEKSSYRVKGLSPDTRYTFKLEACDSLGNWSIDGPSISARTLMEKDLMPPRWPNKAKLEAIDATQYSITLSWPEAIDNRNISFYELSMDGKLLDTIYSYGYKGSYKVSGLIIDTNYNFKVIAVDSSKNKSKEELSLDVSTVGQMKSLLITPDIVIGGESYSEGIIDFIRLYNGKDATIELFTDNEKVLKIPDKIVINDKEGSGIFNIDTEEVDEVTDVTIRAKLKDYEVNATMKVLPPYEYVVKDLGLLENLDILDSNIKFIYDKKEQIIGYGIQDISGRLTLPNDSVSYAMNEEGVIVGELDLSESSETKRGFRFSHIYGLQDLGTLGGVNSSARDINNHGYIVGWSEILEMQDEEYIATQHAFVAAPGIGIVNPSDRNWVEINKVNLTDLGTLGGDSSEAYAINDEGIIVGKSDILDNSSHGFIYSQDKGIRDINDLIKPLTDWEIVSAYDINNIGQILAFGYLDGEPHMCLLTPRDPEVIYNLKVKYDYIKEETSNGINLDRLEGKIDFNKK